MYLAIIVLPILGSIVPGLFGRKVGVSGAQLITCFSVIITTLMATIGFLEVGLNNIPVSVLFFRWVDSESLNVLWGFNFDSLTVSMLIPVLLVSSLVHIYSIGYMSHDPHNQRFFSYLSLFTFMMIVLVTANNFLLMFVGWEGVGVCSYLLVSFWFTRIAANQSSMSAFLTNRVGDCFLTLGMFAIIWTFGNLDYTTVFSLAPYISGNLVTIIGICFLIGAMAKSSQIGLHVWLPLAMEGPTPVSALIHAATMVTAGVYLLMRTSPLIEYSSTVLILCLWIGSITTVFSSLIGLFQQDIKKVIAYSTMSQLGMMVIAVGLSSYNVALFHLVNHAFYKGLLFLGAGAVIHAVADNQDFRKYGGLIAFLPLTYSVMLIASFSLVAFPFMTGFYSKDFILESAYGQFNFSSVAVYFIATIGAMFTTLYSVKVLYLTFLTNANGPLINYKRAHEGDAFMSLPLIILAVFSIFFGYITKDIFIGMASGFFSDNSLFTHPLHETMLETEFAVPTLFKLLPFFLTVTLSALSLILSEFLPKSLLYFKLNRMGYNIFSFFNQRFLIELFYNKYITRYILKLGGQTTKVLDKGSIELLGPYGLEKGLLKLSKSLSSLDTGVITSYALYILIGLILYILIPYISLKDISILLCILFGLLARIVKLTLKNNIPRTHRTHAFVSPPVQSELSFMLMFHSTVFSSVSCVIYNLPSPILICFPIFFMWLFINKNKISLWLERWFLSSNAKDISILSCILYSILSINVEITRPHSYISLPLQSGLFRFITDRIGITQLTLSVFVPVAISYGFYIGYRFPIKFMLDQLGLLQYSPFSSIIITLCSITVIANIKKRKVKPIQVYLAFFFTLSLPLLAWFSGDYFKELFASLGFLFAHLPLIWGSLKDILNVIKGNKMIMGPSSIPSNLFKMGPEGGSSGGGNNGDGGQSSQAGTTSEQAGTTSEQAGTTSEQAEEQRLAETERAVLNLPEEFKNLLRDPNLLSSVMSSKMSILNHYPQFTNTFKTEIVLEAMSRTLNTPAIPNRVSVEALPYWLYHRVYCKANLEENILHVLHDHARAAENASGTTPVASNAFTPDTGFSARDHQQNFKILKAIAFGEMKHRFPTYNHEQRKLITRKLGTAGFNIIDGDSKYSDEELD